MARSSVPVESALTIQEFAAVVRPASGRHEVGQPAKSQSGRASPTRPQFRIYPKLQSLTLYLASRDGKPPTLSGPFARSGRTTTGARQAALRSHRSERLRPEIGQAENRAPIVNRSRATTPTTKAWLKTPTTPPVVWLSMGNRRCGKSPLASQGRTPISPVPSQSIAGLGSERGKLVTKGDASPPDSKIPTRAIRQILRPEKNR